MNTRFSPLLRAGKQPSPSGRRWRHATGGSSRSPAWAPNCAACGMAKAPSAPGARILRYNDHMRYLVRAKVKPGRQAALLEAVDSGSLGEGFQR